ncbi:hypothetical protein F4805DRAFT_90039 [Annulohypoxylon moriforme]|nr:hypothetical protein F4805DRAFT_90039 [Annulohypoxylon moriforme]
MLRSLPKRVTLSACHSPAGTGPSPLKRRFTMYSLGEGLPKVPILRRTIWSIAATATIYFGCATYNVYREARIVKKSGRYKADAINSYDDLYYVIKQGVGLHHSSSHSKTAAKWFPTGQLSTILSGHTDAEKLIICASALNVGLVGAGSLAHHSFDSYFYNIPAWSPNYTLLTSAFGHGGLLHAAINTFVLLQFAPEISRSHIFEGNGSHFAAFYLSAGILSSLGNNYATILPTRRYKIHRTAPTLGTSGVIMALIGAWATLAPDERIGLFLIPVSFSARDFVTYTAYIEMFGLFFGIPFIVVAHGVHLSGLAVGSAYAYFDGREHLWHPTCQFAFLLMKRLNVI